MRSKRHHDGLEGKAFRSRRRPSNSYNGPPSGSGMFKERPMRVAILRLTWGLLALPLLAARAEPPRGIPSPQEMAAAREDVWAEAAIRQPGGPSYEFFKDLLPPLRYVNTAFRHYPLALSAPAAAVKVRWVSNGSGVNLRADKPPMWRELGTPVRFLVGDKPEPFGDDPARITGPHFADGYLPVVRVGYAA